MAFKCSVYNVYVRLPCPFFIITAFTAWSASLHFIFSLVFDVASDDGGAVSRGVGEEIANRSGRRCKIGGVA